MLRDKNTGCYGEMVKARETDATIGATVKHPSDSTISLFFTKIQPRGDDQNGKTDIGDQLKVLRHISAQNDSSVKAEHPDWILSKSFSCSFPANGFYILISALNNNKAVDLNGGSTNNGANIQ